MTEQRPEPGRHTTLAPGDRVRHWSEGYLGRVTAIQPMDEPLPDYCLVELDQKGATVTVPHNQLVRVGGGSLSHDGWQETI